MTIFETIQEKKCSHCGELKDFSQFSKSKSMKYGLDAQCKDCRSKARKLNRWDLKWARNNPEKQTVIAKRSKSKLRLDCLSHYSNGDIKCACCGEKHLEFLAIDHINGGGNKQRNELRGKSTIYQWLKNNNYPKGYRILCHNCNSALGYYGYCPHQKEENGNI